MDSGQDGKWDGVDNALRTVGLADACVQGHNVFPIEDRLDGCFK